MARCLLELSLQDYELSQIRPSMLALCMWKSALEHVNTDDGNFLPPGLFFTREDFQHVFHEVKMFSENLQQSFPEIVNICDHYSNMYSQEWRHLSVSWWKKVKYILLYPPDENQSLITMFFLSLFWRPLWWSTKCAILCPSSTLFWRIFGKFDILLQKFEKLLFNIRDLTMLHWCQMTYYYDIQVVKCYYLHTITCTASDVQHNIICI